MRGYDIPRRVKIPNTGVIRCCWGHGVAGSPSLSADRKQWGHLGDSLVAYYKTKDALTVWPSSCPSRCLLREVESMFTRNCSFIYNFGKLEVVLEAVLSSTWAIVGGDQWAEICCSGWTGLSWLSLAASRALWQTWLTTQCGWPLTMAAVQGLHIFKKPMELFIDREHLQHLHMAVSRPGSMGTLLSLWALDTVGRKPMGRGSRPEPQETLLLSLSLTSWPRRLGKIVLDSKTVMTLAIEPLLVRCLGVGGPTTCLECWLFLQQVKGKDILLTSSGSRGFMAPQIPFFVYTPQKCTYSHKDVKMFTAVLWSQAKAENCQISNDSRTDE